MIALRQDVFLVAYDDGHLEPFDVSKLTRSILKAARRAGHHHWPLAEHVASAVSTYFQKDWPQPTVGRHHLLQAVREILRVIGYPDISAAYQNAHGRAVLDLADLAIQTPSGFDLEFFRLLDTRLERLCAAGPTHLEFRHLHFCVKILSGKRSYRTRCKGLSEEVLAFIRQKLAARFSAKDCSFVVSS
jgi:hypothetical protein